MEALALEEPVPVDGGHEAGTQTVKHVFHHLDFLLGAGVVTLVPLSKSCVIHVCIHYVTSKHIFKMHTSYKDLNGCLRLTTHN